MLKHLRASAATAFLAAVLASPAQAATSQSFTVAATVSAEATISFPSGFTYNFSASDNTSAHLASTNNNTTNIVNVDAVSSAGSGGALEIFFTAPSTIPGTQTDSIPAGAFSYQCTGTYTLNTGINGAQTTTTVSASSFTPVVSPGNNDCLKLTGGNSMASSALTLNLFFDDRFAAADTYTSSGFAVAVTAS